MTAALRRPELAETVFGFVLAARFLAEVLPRWVQDLGLIIEKVDATRPAGAPEDWQPGRNCVCPLPRGTAATAAWCAGRR